MESLDSSAVKTYRYLRLGMVVLVVVLGASILLERADVSPGCWQTSISAYYYTPVRPIFVGVLIAIGVALITVKGSTSFEDIVLNLAGMFAPVVALVPTSGTGPCMSVPFQPGDTDAFVDNNIRAVAIGGAVSLAIALGVAMIIARQRGAQPGEAIDSIDRPSRYGLLIAAVAIAGGVVWYLGWPDNFDRRAHFTSAVLMFVFIGIAVAGNARAGAVTARYRRIYWAIAAGMVLGGAIIGGIAWIGSWSHWVLWLEATEIGLFAAFWAAQTVELWNEGTRADS